MQNKTTLEQIKNLISQNDISFIDIRFTNSSGVWQGLSFLAKDFNFDILNGLNFEGTNIAPINLSRHFIDPFLAHKTLVFLSEDAKAVLEPSTDFSLLIKVIFEILEDNINNLYSMPSIDFLAPPYDNAKDIRAEIVQALNAMNVKTYTHYMLNLQNNKSKHILMLQKTIDRMQNIDNIQKTKYAILMVAKAYKIKINTNFGVFKDYSNPYILI
jgi:glutamine synthetase